MKLMRLKDNVLKELLKHKDARRALEDLHGKSFYTIDRWLRTNDPMLCHTGSIEVICAYLKYDQDEIIVKEEHDFKTAV